jgi:hypothetical protein
MRNVVRTFVALWYLFGWLFINRRTLLTKSQSTRRRDGATITTIQVKDTIAQVQARQAEGEEYQRLRIVVTRQNSQYLEYQKTMTR